MEDTRYPIGPFSYDKDVTAEKRAMWIAQIADQPRKAAEALKGLTTAQLGSAYRDGGWTVSQVIHHATDGSINSFVRCKLALTVDSPAIVPYAQDAWAALPDASKADPALSLAILEGLHARWVLLLRSLKPEDFSRTFTHPERGRMTLDMHLQLCAWHGNHHIAQIMALRKRKGW